MTTRKIRIKDGDNEALITTIKDYMKSDVVKVIKRHSGSNPGTNFRWYLEPEDEQHTVLLSTVDYIEASQSAKRMLNIQFARLYGNVEAISFPFSNLLNASADSSTQNRIALNVIQAVIDTCAAKIAKDQPKVEFITSGSEDYFLKLKARKLTKFIYGWFKKAGVYDLAESVFRDASITGTGFIKLYKEDNDIKTEFCPINTVLVDDLDGLNKTPRCMYQWSIKPKDLLIYKYPDHAKEIMSASAMLSGKIAANSTTEMVRVIEAWHIPSSKTADDGVHTIALDTVTLFSEPYNKDYFPIIPYRWMERPLGFFGRSITEEIKSIQIEINKLLKTIQQSIELIATPIIFVPTSAQIAEDVLLNNTIARMVPYEGQQPPSILTPTAQNAEVYEHLKWLVSQAYQVVGVSQASASGQKPSGVNSAVAMREVSDLETTRFSMASKRWEDWFVSIARIAVDMFKDLVEEGKDPIVGITEKHILQEIRFKDINLEDNPYDIQTFPVNQLPDSPAGRMQTISEYIQNNYISKEKGMELLNLGDPDLESEVNMQTSSIRLVEKNISEMIEDNIYTRPDPHINLQQAALIAQQAYCQLVIDNAPEKGLDLLRNYIDEIQATLNPPKPPMPPPPPQGSAPLPNQIPLNAPINSPAPTLPSPSLAPVS